MYNHLIAMSIIVTAGVILHYIDLDSLNNLNKRRQRKAYTLLHIINSIDGPNRVSRSIRCLRRSEQLAFEILVLNILQLYGFKLIRYRRLSEDNGITGELMTTDRRLYLVEIRRYTNYMSLLHWYDFQQSIDAERASGGLFIHTGKPLPGIQVCPCKEEVHLIGGRRLINMLNFQLEHLYKPVQ